MNALQTAAELYRCRDAARTLFGAEYEAKIAQWKELVAEQARLTKRNVIEAAIALNSRIAKDRPADGYTLMLIFAAAVEIAEPSTPSNEEAPRGTS